jgi:hypothetical protein
MTDDVYVIGITLEDISCRSMILEKISYDETMSELKNWPKFTSMPCFNCLNTFETIPIALVSEWLWRGNERQIKTHRCFCSPSCAKAYLFAVKDPIFDQREIMKYSELLLAFVRLLEFNLVYIEEAKPYYEHLLKL